ncbi:5-formyltetrahydrofolate cyclo-ligase [Parvibaculum sp.]|uniref:5-formyltetrahydrofolate cyclo-ligase n=1 Tax=Parvibaculum sp. TaxID=2024848 RepID=UPI001D2CC79D|nr:5-formyltetrahydrofolate cyclo-ligase [Parvibaculum sp.]MBX3489000.1 5-formyltetrahydrofolate cyclo-ligase [Parvibaculum sp.]MCW5727131.1 5-formyltetrahydrofolate cyclo-ligase [Parvibaculum sp.]
MSAAKRAARAAAILRRDAARDAAGPDAGARIADHFFKAVLLPRQASIAGYVAMGSEADPAEVIARASAAGHVCALPRVAHQDAPLVFLQWRPGDALVAGAHGTREPAPGALACRPDVVLVPLLAFDARGRRIGYGGGYYDRTLAALRHEGTGIVAVGIAFSAQEAEDLPEEEFDARLDWVVTETGARAFAAAPRGV